MGSLFKRLLARIGCNGMKSMEVDLTPLIDGTCDVYREDDFGSRLALERKRAERSRGSCILILVNFGPPNAGANGNIIKQRVSCTLKKITRETDVVGWHRQDHILGGIFTEIERSGRIQAADKILERFRARLKEDLDQHHMAALHISFCFFPESESSDGMLNEVCMQFYPDLAGPNPAKKRSLFLKRIVDIVGSISCIVLLSPLLLLIACLVKATSEGPALFQQERLGRHGRKFNMLKFRSMYIDNDPGIHKKYIKNLIECRTESSTTAFANNGANVYKMQNDPRVTRIGRFLRKMSLDELPQLFNVLIGDMSLVGPRPPIPYEFEQYDLWHRRRVLEVKPGMTGLWQVKGRSRTTFDEMVRMDIRYAMEWSLWMDVKLLLQTPWAVVKGTGAY
jgi:lipopolysaccharide/colanic/teichoic acid biosynthesis glycosyltransferase